MLIRLGFALYFIMQSNIALASLPYAIGEIESPECTDAMKIATKMSYRLACHNWATR